MRLVWLGSAWLLGLAGGASLRPWWPVGLCAGLALLALAGLYQEWRRVILPSVALLVVVALGVWRGGALRTPAADLPAGQIEAARGRVLDWPDRRDRGSRMIVALDSVKIDGRWHGASARIWADAPLYPPLWRGDQVELYGYYRPVEAIALPGFRDALRRRGLHGQFRAFSLQIREAGPRDSLDARRAAVVDWLSEGLRRHIVQPEAGLVTGVLLGDANQLPKPVRDAFNNTGVAHVMALSGWNIALVAGLCALLGQRLGRQRAWYWLLGSAGLIWLYTLLVGGGASLIRAAIMGTLYLVASATGRQADALTALVAAAVVMTAITPATIFDLGFQLSCAATAGLIVCAGRLTRRLHRLPPLVAEGLTATVAAEVFTLPLALHAFGRLSTVTLPANLLIEPLVPLVMAGGVATVVAGTLGDFPGDLVGLAAWLPARALLFVVERLGALPWVTFSVSTPPLPAVMALYALLGAALTARDWLPRLRRWPAVAYTSAVLRPARAPLAYGVAGGLALAAWLVWLTEAFG